MRLHTSQPPDDPGEDQRLVGLVQADDGTVILGLDLEQPAQPGTPQHDEWLGGLAALVDTAGTIVDGHVPSVIDLIIAGMSSVPHYSTAEQATFSGDVDSWVPDITTLDNLNILDLKNDDHWVFIRTVQYTCRTVTGREQRPRTHHLGVLRKPPTEPATVRANRPRHINAL